MADLTAIGAGSPGLTTWGFLRRRRQAALAGVRVVYVNPAYTSQTCSQCGHCAKANRTSQAKFLCVQCGYACHADLNAARNIASRAAVIPPNAAPLAG